MFYIQNNFSTLGKYNNIRSALATINASSVLIPKKSTEYDAFIKDIEKTDITKFDDCLKNVRLLQIIFSDMEKHRETVGDEVLDTKEYKSLILRADSFLEKFYKAHRVFERDYRYVESKTTADSILDFLIRYVQYVFLINIPLFFLFQDFLTHLVLIIMLPFLAEICSIYFSREYRDSQDMFKRETLFLNIALCILSSVMVSFGLIGLLSGITTVALINTLFHAYKKYYFEDIFGKEFHSAVYIGENPFGIYLFSFIHYIIGAVFSMRHIIPVGIIFLLLYINNYQNYDIASFVTALIDIWQKSDISSFAGHFDTFKVSILCYYSFQAFYDIITIK